MKSVGHCYALANQKVEQAFVLLHVDPEKDHLEIVDTMEMLQRQLSHRWDCLARQLNLRRQDIHDIRTKDMNDSDRIHLVIEVSEHNFFVTTLLYNHCVLRPDHFSASVMLLRV